MPPDLIEITLALGTNLGDRLANLQAAYEGLPPAVTPTASSPVYETPPWGVTDQPAFLNCVVRGLTALPPLALLDYLKALEVTLGRRPGVRYGPRLIDIDILLYGDQIVNTPRLQIPHPRLTERAFVLVPLAALAPDDHLPQDTRPFYELRDALDGQGIHNFAPPLGERR
jgi:2-amino-4-hydroxy-6-hydroxymethyldihydropteridine diphosphokinase